MQDSHSNSKSPSALTELAIHMAGEGVVRMDEAAENRKRRGGGRGSLEGAASVFVSECSP